MFQKLITFSILFSLFGLAACSPDIATLEEDFSGKVESAFREKNLEQALALYDFKDEPDKYIKELGESLEWKFDRELGSIVFEDISQEILNSTSAGIEYDGVWYKLDPEPYKMIRMNYKKKERNNDDPTTWGVGSSSPVAIKDQVLVFPGLKRLDKSPKPIKLILPNDFTGKFSVVWLESGADAVETEEFLRYEFPAEGELAVRSLDLFLQDRPKIIEFQDGRTVLPGDVGDEGTGEFYLNPNYMTMTAGRIGAPEGTTSSKYHGTKISWEIKRY